VQLEQSPFLSLVSEQRIQQVLRLMGRSADVQLTPELAREICERTGSAAFVQGSIARLGSQYVVGLRAETPSGQVVDEEQTQASRKEDVLNALDRAAIHLRSKLGESLGSVEKYDTPVEEATTSSLEALKAYSLGRKMFFEKGSAAALPFLKRAVEIDPGFAIAYRALGTMYGNVGQQQRMAENIRKAYALRDKVSERERFYIEANYFWTGTGELEKAIPAYELWRQTYPRDYALYVHLGVLYGSLGNREQALKEARESVRLEPNVENNYLNLVRDYVALNRFDEAEAAFKQVEQRNFEGEDVLYQRDQLAFLRGDRSQMLLAAKGQSGPGHLLLAQQASSEGYYGRLKDARELMQRAIDLAQRDDARETAAGYEAKTALLEVEAGSSRLARADADAAIKMAQTRDVLGNAALAIALAGDVVAAKKWAAELDRDFPADTLVQRYRLPVIYAAVALQRKDAKRAVELLQVTDAIELGDSDLLLPVYLRGKAYLMLRDGNRAATQFQKFIDHRGLVNNFPWGSLARLQLARALALSGDKTRSLTAYQEFFALWKEADSDLTPLRQAKLEYAALQN
jgi:tetratricopeptide (TPR) repeat protein